MKSTLPYRLIDAACVWRKFFVFVAPLLPLFTANAYALDLVEAMTLAQKTDPVFLAAQANYLADQQLLGQARADLLPYISATANQAQNDRTTNSSPLKFDSSGYIVSVRQPLFNWERFAEFGQAKVEVRKAEAEYHAARQELITRLTTLYLDVLSAQDTLVLTRAEKDAISQQLALARARLEVGLGTITEVHDANARYTLSVAQLLDAENLLEDKRQALGESIGMVPSNLKVLKRKFPLLLPDPPDINAWTEKAQQQNLALLAATAEAEIARRELSVKRSGHLPTLDVVGSRTYTDTVFTLGTPLESTNNSIRLELSVPIFSGGKTSKLSTEAKYRHQAATQNMEAIRRSVLRTTRNAFLGIQSDVSRVKALAQAVIAGESALEAKQIGFEAGIETNIDVLNAQRDLYVSKRDYAQSRYSYLLNSLKLRLAAGSLSVKNLEVANSWLE